jgi:hypothetical protein
MSAKSGCGATVIVHVLVATSGVPLEESVACTVKLKAPAAVGVPVIAPECGVSMSPDGGLGPRIRKADRSHASGPPSSSEHMVVRTARPTKNF